MKIQNTENKYRKIKVAIIKKQIQLGVYDWKKAIEKTAERIVQNPESLLWK